MKKMYNVSSMYPYQNQNQYHNDINPAMHSYVSRPAHRGYTPPNHSFGPVHVAKSDAPLEETTMFRPTAPQSNTFKTSYSKEEAAAIALLLGIEFSKSKFNLTEFWMGVNTELEHGKKYYLTSVTGDDPIATGKIALAHLNEFPDYYRRLKVLEDEAKAYWNK
ncbi:DUF5661 family protein [Rossellomorea sp. DA94]|uniref:DUF5661 family protein n=1 Tax=Rossellomorea sp. DA94 TaxID=3038653 RepID=UPI0024472B16|nr:DUF5661 family protein [Rossellomorea sp. DA94]WGG44680.1 hypothetical protein P8596_18175 [Rossellomorea sp. DA94]